MSTTTSITPKLWIASSLLLSVLAACSEAPPPTPPEVAAVVAQGAQLRYPANHPHLALLKAVEAQPSTAASVELPARLIWNESRTQRIYAPLSGRVTAIRADVGQLVKSGTLLASLASADLGQVQADAIRANVDVSLAEKTLQRQRELLDAGVLARKDFEQAEADLSRARTESSRTAARVHLYSGNVGSVNQALGITSGISGLVVERNLNPGQELRQDQSGVGVPPLFVISDPTSLWIQVEAHEIDVASLKPGSPLELTVPTLPDKTFVGKVIAVSDAIDPITRTVKVRGEVANADRILKAEMLATVKYARAATAALSIPANAVELRNGKHIVYVQTDAATFEPRVVETSSQDSKEAIIANGLKKGDRVVVENTLLLSRQFAISREGTSDTAGASGSAASKQENTQNEKSNEHAQRARNMLAAASGAK